MRQASRIAILFLFLVVILTMIAGLVGFSYVQATRQEVELERLEQAVRDLEERGRELGLGQDEIRELVRRLRAGEYDTGRGTQDGEEADQDGATL